MAQSLPFIKPYLLVTPLNHSKSSAKHFLLLTVNQNRKLVSVLVSDMSVIGVISRFFPFPNFKLSASRHLEKTNYNFLFLRLQSCFRIC